MSASTPAALPRIDSVSHPPPFNLKSWIASHKSQLQPPVNNAMVYGRDCQFKLMVIGGPNIRTDFHINRGEEWFHQLQGDMVLKVVDAGLIKDVVVREGDSFLLPGNVPHSPQRLRDTLGLVMERERAEDELDGLRWYCRSCNAVVHEEFFKCVDLGTQIKEKITAYYASEQQRTCAQCGTVDQVPSLDRDKIRTVEDIIRSTSRGNPLPKDDSGTQDGQQQQQAEQQLSIDRTSAQSVIVASHTTVSAPPHTRINPETHPLPFSLPAFISAHASSLRPPVANKLLYGGSGCEYQIQIVGGPNSRTDFHIEDGEEWFYQLQGDMLLRIVDGGVVKDLSIAEGESFLLPAHVPHSQQRLAGTVGLVIERRRERGWQQDGLRWYCRRPGCDGVVYEDRFTCTDLGSQLKTIIESYYGDERKRTCSKCGQLDPPPSRPAAAAAAVPPLQPEEKEEKKNE